MDDSSEQPVPILELDATLATAIVAMLRRQGCPAATTRRDGAHVVVVPRSRRAEALALVADAMDELVTSVERHEHVVEPAADDEPHRTMLLPRLRGAGISILLVPVLVVTLSVVNIPLPYAGFLVVAGMVALVALRDRADRDDG